MRQAGPSKPSKIISLWREAGAWWDNEPSRELTVLIDEKGIRRQVERELPSIGGLLKSQNEDYREDCREEAVNRARKVRDEKVSQANRIADLDTPRYAIGKKIPMPRRELRRDEWG